MPDNYGKLPLSFEANQGQTDSRVRFVARGGGYNMYLTSSEVLLSLHRFHGSGPQKAGPEWSLRRRMDLATVVKNVDAATITMQLIGSNPDAQSVGIDPLPGKVNYLMGKDPRKWHTDVPTYAKVRLSQVYPGVDLVYYGNQEGQLEHDFVVAPDADPNQIEFDVRYQDRTPTLTRGELRLATNAGEVTLRAPLAYQIIGGQRKQVEAAYDDASSGRIRFKLGRYERQQPLVIDPVLAYSAVFGGSPQNYLSDLYVQGMGIDSQHNVYVAGLLFTSPGFPLVDPYQSTPGGNFVSKLNPGGTALLYSTYLGGEQTYIHSLAVDAEGRAYIGGATLEGEIPIVNAAQPTFGGNEDGFITVLNPAGNAVEWSTYIGGLGFDLVNAVAVDASDNLYATGTTGGYFPASHNFSPTECSANTGDSNNVGCIWVAKYGPAGALQYSTLFGPGAATITADSAGSAYLTGNYELFSTSWVLPTTPGAYSSKCNETQIPGGCAFVAKLSPAGDSLLYSTTLGANTAAGSAIKVDRFGDAYVGGNAGPGFPIWSSAFQKTCVGTSCGLVLKLNATGSALIWSTYLGDGYSEYLSSLSLDQYDQVYVSGYTTSPDFPLKAPIQNYAGPYNASNPTAQFFVATLSGSLSSIEYYSTYFGTAASYYGPLLAPYLAVDPALNVYMAATDTNNVQPTPGAYSVGASSLAASWKVLISKLTIMDDVAVALSATPAPVTQGSDLTYTIAVTSNGPDFGVNVRASDTLTTGTTFVSYDAGGGTCTAPDVGGTGSLNCTFAQLNAGNTWTVKLTVKVVASSGTTLSDSVSAVSNMQDFVPANNLAQITTKVD